MSIKLVTVHEEIKVIGFSYAKLGLPGTLESLTKMWDMYGAKYRGKVKNAVLPLVDYGINAALTTDKHEYIAGCAVTEFDALDDDWTSFIVPSGEYIKHSRNKMDDLFKYENNVKDWAKINNIIINGDFMVEVYPIGAFEGKGLAVYTLYPIQK